MTKIIVDALIDAGKTIPLLLTAYLLIELLEYRYSAKIREKVEKAGKAGPLLGALAGVVPQCGFSVIGAALYSQRLLTIGTLLAVLIATSDEAIPVILSKPGHLRLIVPLLLVKLLVAIIAGYTLDLFFRKRNQKVAKHVEQYSEGECHHDHNSIVEEKACCGHSYPSKKFNPVELISHPLVHTAKIFVFIFAVTLFINWIFFFIGENNVRLFLTQHSFWQPFAAVLVGLIPNCASSVALAELYLNGTIGFGPVIAGLSSAGGLGLIVLFRENKNRKETLLIISILILVSLLAGMIIEYFL